MDKSLFIAIIAVSSVLIITAICTTACIISYMFLKVRTLNEKKLMREEMAKKKPVSLEYSKEVLEFTRMVIGQIAVLKFKAFQDAHQMDKITQANVKTLASDVAIAVNIAIKNSDTIADGTVFTREFYTKYIVDVSINMIKDLVDKNIDEITE